ncbi:nSTAND1 domain-containing NTPase [Nocardia jiangxiensis]|uniref:nSTAND1 domain-containing NTPase n=1 Tax=Nocardia jiangxiensis TaxID=282685 RepID=UPI0035712951
MSATAERAWTGLSEFQQAAAKQVLLGLITVGRDSRDTRRRVSREELTRRAIEAADAALEALARTRLITLDAETAYLTHEIVLDAWPRLRTWLDEDRVGLEPCVRTGRQPPRRDQCTWRNPLVGPGSRSCRAPNLPGLEGGSHRRRVARVSSRSAVPGRMRKAGVRSESGSRASVGEESRPCGRG